jgi:proline dehydrogenase
MELLNKAIASLLPIVPKSIVRRVSSRYIAGSTLDDAVATVKRLNSAGAMATVDVLGEFISKLTEAEENTNYACEVLRRTAEEGLKSNLSIKLTSLGMGLDNAACERNVRRILNTARANGDIFVRFDMENSPYTSITIDLYRRLRKEYPNIGVVLQAYLRRTESDIKLLLAEGNTNVRLCKGIYIESEEIAFKGKEEIRQNFTRCLDLLLAGGAYVGIATHDDPLIASGKELVKKHKREINTYEFQMLLGVREQVRDEIIREGYRLRVYVPFGADWYGYSIRRLKENPSIAGHIVKAFFARIAGK